MIISTYLGNRGRKYEKTRHNIAWIMLNHLDFCSTAKWSPKFKGLYAKLDYPESIHLKPETLMNRSGESVAAAMRFFKLEHENLIVAHDDLELPFGTVQIKKGGGAGGHNGLRSIIKLSGSPDFFRFRLGISRPPAGREVSSWVLSRFAPEEEALLPGYLESAARLFEKMLENGPEPGSRIQLLNFQH